jgi:hypothetical protein
MFSFKKFTLFLLFLILGTNIIKNDLCADIRTESTKKLTAEDLETYLLLIKSTLPNENTTKQNSSSKNIFKEISYLTLPLTFPLAIALSLYCVGLIANKYGFAKENYTFKDALKEPLTWGTGIPMTILCYLLIKISTSLEKACSKNQDPNTNSNSLKKILESWKAGKIKREIFSPILCEQLNNLSLFYEKNQQLNVSENEANLIISEILKTVIQNVQTA